MHQWHQAERDIVLLFTPWSRSTATASVTPAAATHLHNLNYGMCLLIIIWHVDKTVGIWHVDKTVGFDV